MTDASGYELESTEYAPFGSQRAHTGTNTSDYKYTDQELDAENGLYNYNARLYDPFIGRFISPDTIVPDPYNPQSLNRYTYCLNNPLIYVDPSGHIWGWGEIFWKSLKGLWGSTWQNITDAFNKIGGWLGFGGDDNGAYKKQPDNNNELGNINIIYIGTNPNKSIFGVTKENKNVYIRIYNSDDSTDWAQTIDTNYDYGDGATNSCVDPCPRRSWDMRPDYWDTPRQKKYYSDEIGYFFEDTPGMAWKYTFKANDSFYFKATVAEYTSEYNNSHSLNIVNAYHYEFYFNINGIYKTVGPMPATQEQIDIFKKTITSEGNFPEFSFVQ